MAEEHVKSILLPGSSVECVDYWKGDKWSVVVLGTGQVIINGQFLSADEAWKWGTALIAGAIAAEPTEIFTKG